MSARRDWVIRCDADLNRTRAEMRNKGWARKGHEDILVDLCHPCSEKAVTIPARVEGRGRPKKNLTTTGETR